VPLDLLPFLVASVPVTVVPGADMALVTRQFLVGGTRGVAQRTIFGNPHGLVAHGVAQPLTKAINKEHGHIHQFKPNAQLTRVPSTAEDGHEEAASRAREGPWASG
jgi:hypothetical protein